MFDFVAEFATKYNTIERRVSRLETIEKGTATGGGGGGTAVFDDAGGDPANIALTAADGVSTFAARRDHRHAIAGTVIQSLGTAYFAGTSEVTAGTILAKLLTVDGTGTGLDADLLDGLHASAFSGTAHTHSIYAGTSEVTAGSILAKLLTVDGTTSGLDADLLDGLHATAFVGTATAAGFAGTADVTAGTILAKLITVDGASSGLDADLLDGAHLSAIMGSVVAAGMDINALTVGANGTADFVPFYDTTSGSVYKTNVVNFLHNSSKEFQSLSAAGSLDYVAFWDNSSIYRAPRHAFLSSSFLPVVGTVDPANDSIIVSQGSLTAEAKRIVVSDFLSYAGSVSSADVYTYIKANDGTGSTLDADLLDGSHAADFSPVATINTFTPTLTFGGGSTGMTGTLLGSYYKIGRLVFVTLNIALTAKGSSTGTAVIGNLPFTNTNNASYRVALTGRITSATLTGDVIPVFTLSENATTIGCAVIDSGTGANMTDTHFGNSTNIWLSGCYIASS